MHAPALCHSPLGQQDRHSPRANESARRLHLQFVPDGGRTRMSIGLQDQPWRVIRAFPNPLGQAVVHLHNVSGGVLSGDSLDLRIDAEPSSRVQITTAGATRIYRRRPGQEAARISTSIRIDAGAFLEYLPDATIPFSGSNFSQSTAIFLGPGAGYIGWDIIAAGRIARGERFQFDRFHSEYAIHCAARPLALERYVLEPSIRNAASAARWGKFCYTSTLYVCHTGVADSKWAAVEARLNDFAYARTTPDERWGVSALISGGLVVRGLASEAYRIPDGLNAFWALAKQEVWGEPAIPPRKIN
jgi:urease accessory protein